MHRHVRVAGTVSPDDVAKKPGRHRGQNANVQMPYDALTGSACGLHSVVEFSQNNTGLFEKACSSSCRPHASGGSLKERYSQRVFERPHAATDRELLRAKHPGSPVKM